MKKSILNLGSALNKAQQKEVFGGTTADPSTGGVIFTTNHHGGKIATLNQSLGGDEGEQCIDDTGCNGMLRCLNANPFGTCGYS